MKGKIFCEVVWLEEKLLNGGSLTPDEQKFAEAHPLQQPKRCNAPGCQELLPPRVDGERQQMRVEGKMVEVCDDCYSEGLSLGVGSGVGGLGAKRPGASMLD